MLYNVTAYTCVLSDTFSLLEDMHGSNFSSVSNSVDSQKDEIRLALDRQVYIPDFDLQKLETFDYGNTAKRFCDHFCAIFGLRDWLWRQTYAFL